MEFLSFAGRLPLLLMVSGMAAMSFAGLRYWNADPVGFFTTPPWRVRGRFLEPGYHLYLAGSFLALGSTLLLLLRWFSFYSSP